MGSRFTHSAESRYAPVEGEALAVVTALDKARHFVLGCPNLTIAVDHKPLLKLFGDRSIEAIPNPRLRNLKEKTLRYRFRMVHIPGVKHCVADGLSRHPVDPAKLLDLPDDIAMVTSAALPTKTLQDDTTYDTELEDSVMATTVSALDYSPITAVSWDLIRTATASDEILESLLHTIETGFPESKSTLPSTLAQFWQFRESLYTVDGIILYNERILVPQALRPNVISTLHAAHQGVDSMTARAESSVFWPGITKDIREIRERCAQCNRNAPSHPSAPPTPPVRPVYPFQCVCADYFTIGGISYLVIVDRYSNWPLVWQATEGAKGLISALRSTFGNYGAPEEMASDGGPEFTASATTAFLRTWGVHHRLSSVAFPHSNCRAEVGVKTVKRLLSGNTGPSGTLDTDKFLRAILQYKNTPARDTGLSPAECVYGRQLRDLIPTHPGKYLPHESWREVLNAREEALRIRHMRAHERLSQHTKRLPPSKSVTMSGYRTRWAPTPQNGIEQV